MRIAKAALVAAPLCLLVWGVLRLVDHDGVGATQYEQVATAVHLAGLGLVVPGVLGLARMLGPVRGRAVVVVVALAGVVASVASVVRVLPERLAAFDFIGPQLLYVGLIALAAMLTSVDVLPWWSPVFVTAGLSFPVVSIYLTPIGGLCLLVGLWPAVVGGSWSAPVSETGSELVQRN